MSDDEMRPRKRLRLDPASLRLSAPATYASSPAPPFSRPQHLTSFSYTPDRRLLTRSSGRVDEALQRFYPPPIGADLRRGLESCTWRDEKEVEGLDALLDCLLDMPSSRAWDETLQKAGLITWRGMATKLLHAVYEDRDGWEMNAMVLDGTLYLEEHRDPNAAAQRVASNIQSRPQTYVGYAFESYCMSPPGQWQDVNTNVQWCSVVKTSLGSHRLILGGEVDCVNAPPGLPTQTEHFVELKTNMVIASERDQVNFEKYKLCKIYLQSFLLGVPSVVVGFRTRPGILQTVQTFKTLEIPRLVRGKPHAFDPNAALKAGDSLISFIRSTIADSSSTVAAQAAFAALKPDKQVTSLQWPVFRVAFDAGTKALSIEELDEPISTAGRKSEPRVGFLLERWVQAAHERRHRLSAAQVPTVEPPRPVQADKPKPKSALKR